MKEPLRLADNVTIAGAAGATTIWLKPPKGVKWTLLEWSVSNDNRPMYGRILFRQAGAPEYIEFREYDAFSTTQEAMLGGTTFKTEIEVEYGQELGVVLGYSQIGDVVGYLINGYWEVDN